MSQQGRTALPQAFFLPVDPQTPSAGQRFCLFHPARGSALRGRVLYLPPFAEELNTTRRVVAQQARALAAAGYAVLQIDLTGCGDSSGDFADATWAAWLDDAALAHRWLSQSASGPLWIWGMRLGALLATEFLKTLTEPAHLLLWQPVIGGQQMLQQFTRLHTAGQWLGSRKPDEQSPAQLFAQGQSVEIAGYTVSPELAQGMAQARLQPPAIKACGRLIWIELTKQAGAAMSPASEKELSAWRNAGWQVSAQAITAPAFWQTMTIDDAPALISATLAAMAADCAPTNNTQAP
ncbi:hydrolase 2, exosortase A system-associated [Hydrogenophaga sp.]|uniref:hydrolase 2, exosortase A system-associated n=1 Tax=Hydrogenophaga sp. TaxID=1904254 RepID=UPI002FC9C165